MNSLLSPPAACNAALSAVRPDPDPVPVVVPADEPDNEFFTGEYTDAKFEEFLDSHPRRRRDFLSESPREQERYRARVARLWALRASSMPSDLHAAVTLAEQLRLLLKEIVHKYSKDEGRRVLEAAGLPVPKPRDPSSSWGGDHFAHAYRFCRQIARELVDFDEVVWTSLFLMLPDLSEEPLLPPAEGGAAA